MIRKYDNFIRIMAERKLFMHVVCWFLLIAYETLMILFVYKRASPFISYVIYYVVNIAFFYSMVTLWWYGISKRSNWWQQFLRYIVLFGGYLLLKGLADVSLNQRPDISGLAATMSYLPATIGRAVYFAILVAFYITAGYVSRYRRKAVEAEIAYRQQQLQPHLLFNTLNMIYNSVGRHSGEAARCVWLLSELMQYSLNPGEENGKVPVENEIRQVYNLIEINEHRFDHHLFIELNIEETGDARIIPLVLLTLTENLFKHGEVQDANYPARLELKLMGDRLCFRTANHVRLASFVSGKSLGLENTRVRLEHAYSRNFVLTTVHKDDCFELYLEVPV